MTPAGRGRPPLPDAERLSGVLRVGVTVATMRRVLAAAERAGLSVPAWVRRAVDRALGADAAECTARIRRLAGIPDPVAARDALVRAALAWLDEVDEGDAFCGGSNAMGDLLNAVRDARAAGVTG